MRDFFFYIRSYLLMNPMKRYIIEKFLQILMNIFAFCEKQNISTVSSHYLQRLKYYLSPRFCFYYYFSVNFVFYNPDY